MRMFWQHVEGDDEMQPFYVAYNFDTKEPCGHKHKWMVRAHMCARGNERHYRVKYGERQNWDIFRVTWEKIQSLLPEF